MNPGDQVIILAPFADFFPGTYTVQSVDEANTYAQLVGVESAFDFRYIQKVTA